MAEYTPEELAALAADDRGPLCKRIVIAFTVVSFVSVCLRLYARTMQHRVMHLGYEDWTIVVSMIASVGTAVFQVLQVHAGNGKHAIFVQNPEDVSDVFKYLYFSIITYNTSIAITKISILLQYHRIFTLQEMRIPVYVALVIVGAWGITTLGTAIFSCVPLDAYWKVTEQASATCVNRMAVWYTNASVNIVTDLLVAIIPIPGLWGLRIPKRQLIAVLGIFTIGWFVCIVSVLRLHALNVFARHKDDATYYSAPTAYWSAIEANLAIVCASLPALKPLLVRIVPVFGNRSSSGGRSSIVASANNYRLQRLGSMSKCNLDDGEDTLVSDSSASHAQSFRSRPSESKHHERNIYVAKHFEQRVEDNWVPMDSDQEVTTTEFLARGNVQ